MKKILVKIGTIVLAFVFIDLMILLVALVQIAIENRTGYWNPFWKWQAEQVVQILKYVSN
jgi:hypothetical protein